MAHDDDAEVDARALSGMTRFVARHFATLPKGTVLDAPTGGGALAERLLRLGFTPTCCDIDPAHFAVEGLICDQVNLNRDRLPYPDDTFDYVATVGGLHRLFRPEHALREMHRVLKPSGTLVIGLINYSTLLRRVAFLFDGFVSKNVLRQAADQTISDPEANFRFPLFVPRLLRIVSDAGFVVTRVFSSSTARRAWLLLPLVGVVALVARLRARSRPGLFIREASSFSALTGKRYIYVTAKKAPAPVQRV